MPGLGVGLLVLGYAAWYTLYQKTWGDGGSLLYWLTGSKRFPQPAAAAKGSTPSSSGQAGGTAKTGNTGLGPTGGIPAPK